MLLSSQCFSMFLVLGFSFMFLLCSLFFKSEGFNVQFFGGFSFKQNCEPDFLRVVLGPAKRFSAKSFSQDLDK